MEDLVKPIDIYKHFLTYSKIKNLTEDDIKAKFNKCSEDDAFYYQITAKVINDILAIKREEPKTVTKYLNVKIRKGGIYSSVFTSKEEAIKNMKSITSVVTSEMLKFHYIKIAEPIEIPREYLKEIDK